MSWPYLGFVFGFMLGFVLALFWLSLGFVLGFSLGFILALFGLYFSFVLAVVCFILALLGLCFGFLRALFGLSFGFSLALFGLGFGLISCACLGYIFAFSWPYLLALQIGAWGGRFLGSVPKRPCWGRCWTFPLAGMSCGCTLQGGQGPFSLRIPLLFFLACLGALLRLSLHVLWMFGGRLPFFSWAGEGGTSVSSWGVVSREETKN